MSQVLAEEAAVQSASWDGGVSPYKVGHKKLGMWLFILSDSLTFSALLFGYSYVRMSTPNWPTPFEFYPGIIYATVMTACLLSSSLTMVMAVNASGRGDRAAVVKWIGATMLGGLAFLVLHIREWFHLIEEGLTPFKTPTGWPDVPLFGGTFFTITGLHMFHVLTGVVYLGIIAARKKSNHEDVEICGLYWHFVDLVWMFVFPLIYIMSIQPK
jgi:cytochrome c oxidase subunit 3